MATIQIPVLFDMSGDTITYGEEVSGDFIHSHLNFLLDMTTEANDISLNAADISGAVLVGDNDYTDNIFYSGGSSGNIAVDNLCNRIAKAITRGKLIHIPHTGNSTNSGIPMGGRSELVSTDGTTTGNGALDKYAIKYLTSISPIGDEQMLGEAMARVASIHLVGSPLSAGIFENKNSVQTDLEVASGQTFNSGNTAFYNALAVQLSKVLGGSKSSAPMNNGGGSGSGGGDLASQLYYESFDNEDVTFHANADIVYVDGIGGSGKAMSTIGQSPAGFQWVQKVSDSSLPSNVRAVSFQIKFVGSQFIFDNGDTDGRALFLSQFYLKFKNGSTTSGDPSGSGYLPTGTQPTIWYDGAKTMYSNITNSAIGAKVLNGDGTDIHNNDMNDGNWHHFYIEYPDGETLPVEFSWLTNKNGDGASQGSIDNLRYFNAALTPTQIADLAAGNNGTAGITGGYPLDASGTSVPALKSIYEQLMNVPGRSQIMQTRDITNVPMPSGTTLAGGFPFISGDKLVMYLRPKINFAAQTLPEQHTTLVGMPEEVGFSVPVYDIGRKNSDGGALTGQTYTQSSSFNSDHATVGFNQCFEGTAPDSTSYWLTAGTGGSNPATDHRYGLNGGAYIGDSYTRFVGESKDITVTTAKLQSTNEVIDGAADSSGINEGFVYYHNLQVGDTITYEHPVSGTTTTTVASVVLDGNSKPFKITLTDAHDATATNISLTFNKKENLMGEWGQVDIGQDTAVKRIDLWPFPPKQASDIPKNFHLLGSADGTNWDILKKVENEDWGLANAGGIKEYAVTPSGPYRYYRISVQSLVNNASNQNFSLSQMVIWGAKHPTEFYRHALPLDISGLVTNFTATPENITSAFPGKTIGGPDSEELKWGWMGSTTNNILTQDTTDITDTNTIDLHVWKITITL